MTESTSRKRTSKPSDVVEAVLDEEERTVDLLDDLPALKPAHKFRLADRNRFQKLRTQALKANAIQTDDEGNLSYDLDSPEGVERYEAFLDFLASIDEWAESIADDPAVYAEWAEGKKESHFLALFGKYTRALGESNGS